MIRHRRVPVLAIGIGFVLIVAGCGSDDDESDESAAPPPPPAATTTAPSTSGAAGGETLKLSADPDGDLEFTKTELTAKAGKVTLVMDNPSQIPHGVGVEGNGVDEEGETVGNGETSTASADLEAGTYEFYCTVQSHRQAGMKGTLTVK